MAFRRIGPVAAQATAHWLSRHQLEGSGRTILQRLCNRHRELGYLEGRDYGFEERYADGDLPRLPLLAEELATLKPDLIVASTTPGAVAAKQASSSIPIVGVILLCPMSSLERATARPLYELRARDVDAMIVQR